MDYIGKPFEERRIVAGIEKWVDIMRPLTMEEADRAYDESPEIPISSEEINHIVSHVVSGKVPPPFVQ